MLEVTLVWEQPNTLKLLTVVFGEKIGTFYSKITQPNKQYNFLSNAKRDPVESNDQIEKNGNKSLKAYRH